MGAPCKAPRDGVWRLIAAAKAAWLRHRARHFVRTGVRLLDAAEAEERRADLRGLSPRA